MLLHKGLTHIHSQKKLHFGKSFTLIRWSIQHHSNKSNTLACVCTVTFRMHLFHCKLFSHETNKQRVFILQMMQEQTEDFNTSSNFQCTHLYTACERWKINTSLHIKKRNLSPSNQQPSLEENIRQ